MSIRPLYDRVVVRRMEEETTTAGGIVLPGSAAEKPMEGEVVAVGNGRYMNSGELAALQVKVGDKVMFEKFGGTEVKVDGEDLLILREEQIIGVIG